MQSTSESTTREMIRDGIVDVSNKESVVRPYVMSHGTLECYSLKESRKFYEEFLGLECVRHAKPAMLLRCGLKFHVVCVEVGDNVHPVNVLNHWGVDVLSDEEVDKAYDNAVKFKDEYKIRKVMEPTRQHGVYSFYLEDLDHNWWEVQSCADFIHDDAFDFGDRFSEDGEPLGAI
ncbi:MAG: VOC family protein [Pseudomonadota bacterium]